MQPLTKAAMSGAVRTRLPQTRAPPVPAIGSARLRAACTGGAGNAGKAAPLVSRTRRLAWCSTVSGRAPSPSPAAYSTVRCSNGLMAASLRPGWEGNAELAPEHVGDVLEAGPVTHDGHGRDVDQGRGRFPQEVLPESIIDNHVGHGHDLGLDVLDPEL